MADSNTNNAKKATKRTRVILPGGIQGLVRDLQNGTNRGAPTVVEQSDSQEVSTAEENAPKLSQQSSEAAPAATSGQADGGRQDEEQRERREKTEAFQHAENEYAYSTTQSSDNERFAPHSGETAAEGGNGVAESMQVADSQFDRVGVRTPGEDLSNSREKADEMSKPASSSEIGRNDGAFAGRNPSGQTQTGQSAEGQPQARGRRPKENTMKSYTIVKDDSRDSWELFLDMAKQYKDGGGKLATIYIDGQLKNLLDRMKYVGPDKLTTSAILSSIVARFIYDHEDEIRKVLFSGDLL